MIFVEKLLNYDISDLIYIIWRDIILLFIKFTYIIWRDVIIRNIAQLWDDRFHIYYFKRYNI